MPAAELTAPLPNWLSDPVEAPKQSNAALGSANGLITSSQGRKSKHSSKASSPGKIPAEKVSASVETGLVLCFVHSLC